MPSNRRGIRLAFERSRILLPGEPAKWSGLSLGQTKKHVQILEGVLKEFEMDTKEASPGCEIVHDLGASLVAATTRAKSAGPAAAQLVAGEYVVIAKTKDHLDWEKLTGDRRRALQLARSRKTSTSTTAPARREIWRESLGLPAMLPPPEEQKHVKTAIGSPAPKKEARRGR